MIKAILYIKSHLNQSLKTTSTVQLRLYKIVVSYSSEQLSPGKLHIHHNNLHVTKYRESFENTLSPPVWLYNFHLEE